jgi:[ribosomal protein S5]-alanine N-acetyltransferase
MTTAAQVGCFVARDLNPWEGPALFVMTGNPDVTRYMGFRTHKSVDEATKLIEQYRNSPTKWLAVCPAEAPGDIIGVVGFEVARHQATMSIMFRPDWKARGAGREFCKPFVQWIFTHPQIWRLWTYVHISNIQGQRVTERMGATREGLLRRFEFFPNVSTEPQACYIYSITR